MRREHLSFHGEVRVDQLADRLGLGSPHRPFHTRLTDGIDRALRHGRPGHVCLRSLVFELVQHATAAGVSPDEVRSTLVEFINEHPLCDCLDRFCLFDGRRVSERLGAQVSGWVDTAWSGHRRHAAERAS